MAKKKKDEKVTYWKRYYGLEKREEIGYDEAHRLVAAAHPDDADAMLTVPNTIRCEKCVVYVEVENVVLIKGEFEVVPEE